MNGVGAQILSGRFAAIAQEGLERFARMARSAPPREEGACACALLDRDARLIAQAQGSARQLAAPQATVAAMADAFAYDLAEGDLLLAGDPYCGGVGAGELVLAAPFFASGELQGFAALRFAVDDLGGELPGPLQPEAHEIWREGLRVTPVKLVRARAARRDVRRYLLKNSRAPVLLDADLTNAAAVATDAATRMESLIAAQGVGTIRAAAEARIAYGASRMRAHLAELSCGAGGAGWVAVAATRRDDGLTLDFRESAPSSNDPANLTRAGLRAVALAQLAAPVIADAGMSQGVLDALEIATTPGTVVDPAFPAATGLGWRLVAPQVSAALAQATGTPQAVHAPGPMMTLFESVGSAAQAAPVALSPGARLAPGSAGGDAAAGGGRAPSAEEMESAGWLRMLRRDLDEDGLSVTLATLRGGLEGACAPGDQRPGISQSAPLHSARDQALRIAQGARIDMTYTMREGEA